MKWILVEKRVEVAELLSFQPAFVPQKIDFEG